MNQTTDIHHQSVPLTKAAEVAEMALDGKLSEQAWAAFEKRYSRIILGYLMKKGLCYHDAQDALFRTYELLSKRLKSGRYRYEPERVRLRRVLFRIASDMSVEIIRKNEQHLGKSRPDRENVAAPGTHEGLASQTRSASQVFGRANEIAVPSAPPSQGVEHDQAFLRQLFQEALQVVRAGNAFSSRNVDIFSATMVDQPPLDRSEIAFQEISADEATSGRCLSEDERGAAVKRISNRIGVSNHGIGRAFASALRALILDLPADDRAGIRATLGSRCAAALGFL